MIRVGLTGNLGSGKSTVAKIFQILGVPVYYADDASRGFLSEPAVKTRITGMFGTRVLTNDQQIDRKLLGQIVFSDPAALQGLNSILHPLVRKKAREWNRQHAEFPYVVHEAAIIYESGFRDEYDTIIHVSAPPEIAISRAMQRDNASRKEILARTRFQWDDNKKTKLADYVIVNDGSELVIPRVLELHRVLTGLSAVSSQESTVDQ